MSATLRAFAIVGGVLLVGITLAVRRRGRGLNPVPVDAATLGAIVLIGVLAVVFLFPLTER